MSINPESINARSQPSAYSFTGSFDSAIKPCKGWVAVEAFYTDKWKTPVTGIPLRIADAQNVVIDGTATTRNMASYGVTDGDTEVGQLAELGTFHQAEVAHGRVDVSAIPNPAGDAEAEAGMQELGTALTNFRDQSIGALQYWVIKWEQNGVLSIPAAYRDGVLRGLQSWWSSEADFWGGVSSAALNAGQQALDWYQGQPWYKQMLPGLIAADWLFEKISDSVATLIMESGKLAEYLDTIMQAMRKFATGIVNSFQDGIDLLIGLPGEYGKLFATIKATGHDWVQRAIKIASETNAFEYIFHCGMAVVMNMTPNFWADMVGVAAGYILPEVIIELILAAIAALSGGTLSGLLAGRLLVLTKKITQIAGASSGLAAFLKVINGFADALKALKKIGDGLHKTIADSAVDASNRVVRLRHELAQLEFKIDPNTLGMNGGNIRIVRKGKPHGKRTKVLDQDDAATRRSIERENESADILARKGYDVEQNPNVPGNMNPDYKINGEIYDNYAPSTGNPRNIWSEVEGKVMRGQTENVVINLKDSPVDMTALSEQFSEWPIDGLKDVIVIRPDGTVGGL